MLTPNGVDGKTEILRDMVDGQDRTVLFVNSSAYPDKHIPLNHYKHDKGVFSKTTFFRLYRDVWNIDVGEGNVFEYSVLQWYEVSVKNHCKQALINMIDMFEAAEEFLHR